MASNAILVLCYSRCSTCKKALKWLDDHHIAYESRDIKEANPSEDELAAWHARSGLPIRRFFNTSGMVYRPFASGSGREFGSGVVQKTQASLLPQPPESPLMWDISPATLLRNSHVSTD